MQAVLRLLHVRILHHRDNPFKCSVVGLFSSTGVGVSYFKFLITSKKNRVKRFSANFFNRVGQTEFHLFGHSTQLSECPVRSELTQWSDSTFIDTQLLIWDD